MNEAFKEGDTVIVCGGVLTSRGVNLNGKVGVVVRFSGNMYGVDFGEYVGGHNNQMPSVQQECGWYLFKENLMLYSNLGIISKRVD